MTLNTRDAKPVDGPKNSTKKPTVQKSQTRSFQADVKDKGTPQRNLSMNIDADLHRKLKFTAVSRGQTIREVVMGMIRELDE